MRLSPLLLALLAAPSAAATLDATPATLAAKLSAAKPGDTVRMTGNWNFSANSKSRGSSAGTAMIAPVP